MANPVYPSTQLAANAKDAPFGGQPANRWGSPQRAFVDAEIQALEQMALDHNRVPYQQIYVTCTNNGVAGDGVVFDAQAVLSGGAYSVRRLASSFGTVTTDQQIRLGLLREAVSAGNGVRVIIGGVVPQAITGLTPGASGEVTFDATTGRLRAKAAGERTEGYADAQGNVFLLFPGMIP